MSNFSKKSKIDLTDVCADQMETAKCLFETVSSVLGSSLRSHISPAANFFSLGGNSLNAIYTISKLADLGYSIGMYMKIYIIIKIPRPQIHSYVIMSYIILLHYNLRCRYNIVITHYIIRGFFYCDF